MDIGWVGLGKLGLPCAMVLALHHRVTGFDVDSRPGRFAAGDTEALPWVEPGVTELTSRANLHIVSDVDTVVEHADVIFVAVQTPHAPQFGGEVPVSDETRDFEYAYLVQAVRDISRASLQQQKSIVLVVVSTVLPGTMTRHIRSLLHPLVRLVYSPQFIAMGTTLYDFEHPEFLLLGGDDAEALELVSNVFRLVHGAPRFATTVENAELIKVAYNTFISLKITWANHIGQICDAVGADADAVVDALALATDRVISPAYMRAGMGDGGACHPRDLIALADLERRVNAPPFFAEIARMRDEQARHFARTAVHYSQLAQLPIALLGKAYKPHVSLTAGSPALLLRHILETEHRVSVTHWDPHVEPSADWPEHLGKPHVFVIATRHDDFIKCEYARGSVVIDPFGYIGDRPGVTLVTPGRS